MSSKYYCTKCEHNHYYSSKIGKKHLKYKSTHEQTIKHIQNNEKDAQNHVNVRELISEAELENSFNKVEIMKGSDNRVLCFIRDYQRSYRKGAEMYGVWWKVFQLSIWSIIMIFLLTASMIFIVFLPKIDLINWILR